MNAAVYNFQTAEELQILLHSALYKYAGSSSALEWIEKLITDQTKVSRAHTAKHFTAKTAELRKFNLFQFLQHYISMVERQEAESLNIIEKLVQDRREYSDFVKDIWESEHRLSYQHSFTKIVDDNGDSATVWKVISTRGSCHLVRLDSKCSSCECVSFRSTLIPCRHICCFAISMQIDPFNVR